MRIRYIIFIAALFIPPFAHAGCNLRSLDFGISQQDLKQQFAMDEVLDVAEAGEATIVIGAADICADLPEESVLEFVLIDNKFVQMRVINQASGVLLDYASKVFGERDNIDKDKKIKPGDKIKLGLWSEDGSYSILYAVYTAGKNELEKLVITSKKHKDLFAQANEIKTKAADDYLKENRLGIYASGYNSKDEVTGSGNQAKPDAGNKRNLKENDSSRGYHYE